VLHFKYQILPEGKYDVGVIVLAMALAYIVVSRRSSTGETAGERLFDISYVHRGLRTPVAPDPFDDEDEDSGLAEAVVVIEPRGRSPNGSG